MANSSEPEPLEPGLQTEAAESAPQDSHDGATTGQTPAWTFCPAHGGGQSIGAVLLERFARVADRSLDPSRWEFLIARMISLLPRVSTGLCRSFSQRE